MKGLKQRLRSKRKSENMEVHQEKEKEEREEEREEERDEEREEDRGEGEREQEGEIAEEMINATTLQPSAPLLSELSSASVNDLTKEEEKNKEKEKEKTQEASVAVTMMKPRYDSIDIMDAFKCVFPEIENNRLSKWRTELRNQDIYTLSDILALESESMKILSTHLSVKCYDCLLKLYEKCCYVVVCLNKHQMTGIIQFQQLNGIYVHLPHRDVYCDMPMFRQIITHKYDDNNNNNDKINNNKDGNNYCIYFKDSRWRIYKDLSETRGRSSFWMYSKDDLLSRLNHTNGNNYNNNNDNKNNHGKCQWMYYCTEEKINKPYTCPQFGDDIIVDCIMKNSK